MSEKDAAPKVARWDVAYLLVLVWAFIGIAVKQAGTPLVSIGAWVATALVVGCIALARLARLARRSGGGAVGG